MGFLKVFLVVFLLLLATSLAKGKSNSYVVSAYVLSDISEKEEAKKIEWEIDTDTGENISSTISKLKAGKGMVVFTYFRYMEPGEYHLTANIDYDNKIFEAYEDNNIMSLDLSIG